MPWHAVFFFYQVINPENPSSNSSLLINYFSIIHIKKTKSKKILKRKNHVKQTVLELKKNKGHSCSLNVGLDTKAALSRKFILLTEMFWV